MTVRESPVESPDVPTDERVGVEALELLTDDGVVWTVVPADATGDERMTQWVSVDRDLLCDLEAMR